MNALFRFFNEQPSGQVAIPGKRAAVAQRAMLEDSYVKADLEAEIAMLQPGRSRFDTHVQPDVEQKPLARTRSLELDSYGSRSRLK